MNENDKNLLREFLTMMRWQSFDRDVTATLNGVVQVIVKLSVLVQDSGLAVKS